MLTPQIREAVAYMARNIPICPHHKMAARVSDGGLLSVELRDRAVGSMYREECPVLAVEPLARFGVAFDRFAKRIERASLAMAEYPERFMPC